MAETQISASSDLAFERSIASEQVIELRAVCDRERALVALLAARGEKSPWAEDLLLGFEASLARTCERLSQL